MKYFKLILIAICLLTISGCSVKNLLKKEIDKARTLYPIEMRNFVRNCRKNASTSIFLKDSQKDICEEIFSLTHDPNGMKGSRNIYRGVYYNGELLNFFNTHLEVSVSHIYYKSEELKDFTVMSLRKKNLDTDVVLVKNYRLLDTTKIHGIPGTERTIQYNDCMFVKSFNSDDEKGDCEIEYNVKALYINGIKKDVIAVNKPRKYQNVKMPNALFLEDRWIKGSGFDFWLIPCYE